MATPEILTLQPAAWSARTAELLSSAEQAASLADLAGQVEAGVARLFHVCAGGEVVAAYVLRVDHGVLGDEGVILSAAGRAGIDLTAAVLPAIEQQFSGVVATRLHTARAGLMRKAGRLGYRAVEVVMRKEISRGQ